MKEELKKLAEDYSCQYMAQDYIQVSYDSFLCGADAAEDALIKKVCEWLENNLTYYISVEPRGFEGYELVIEKEEFLTDFKKAVED